MKCPCRRFNPNRHTLGYRPYFIDRATCHELDVKVVGNGNHICDACRQAKYPKKEVYFHGDTCIVMATTGLYACLC
jgi:hypothetical protein